MEGELVYFDPDECKKHPYMAMVEDRLGGVGRLMFPDGTEQFAGNETFPDVVSSPRLPPDQLETFCSVNIARYEAYFEENFAAINEGDDLPPIDRFWE